MENIARDVSRIGSAIVSTDDNSYSKRLAKLKADNMIKSFETRLTTLETKVDEILNHVLEIKSSLPKINLNTQ